MADAPGKSTPWWLCPNEPPCPHARVVHDVYDLDDPLPRCCAWGCDCGRKPEPVTHQCPVGDGGLTPCCGLTPFELPGTDRITEDPERVTCRRIASA